MIGVVREEALAPRDLSDRAEIDSSPIVVTREHGPATSMGDLDRHAPLFGFSAFAALAHAFDAVRHGVPHDLLQRDLRGSEHMGLQSDITAVALERDALVLGLGDIARGAFQIREQSSGRHEPDSLDVVADLP
jgi:hypothetical protein